MQRLKVKVFFKVKVFPFPTVFIFTTSKQIFPVEKVVYPFEDVLLYATYQADKKDRTGQQTFVANIQFRWEETSNFTCVQFDESAPLEEIFSTT